MYGGTPHGVCGVHAGVRLAVVHIFRCPGPVSLLLRPLICYRLREGGEGGRHGARKRRKERDVRGPARAPQAGAGVHHEGDCPPGLRDSHRVH